MRPLAGLLERRSGPVDPNACHLCATLRDKFEKHGRDGDFPRQSMTVTLMQLHKDFGHPDPTPTPSAPTSHENASRRQTETVPMMEGKHGNQKDEVYGRPHRRRQGPE